MDDILSLLIPIVGFVCLTIIVRAVVEARVRRRLAETHASEELLTAMMQADERNRKNDALKWGLVFSVMGVAFVIIDLLDLTTADPATYGLLLGAAGAGLLLHRYLQKPAV